MAAMASLSYAIKVPVHARVKRASMPPVAARLQAREAPTRAPTTPEKIARKELIIGAEKARKSAIAAAHNARVNDAVNNATLMKSQINEYVRISTDRRLMEAEANREAQLEERAGKAKKFVQRVDSVAEKNQSRKMSLAAQTSRKLEAAKQLRQRKLAKIQFKAADATARAKSIALNNVKDTETKKQQISSKVETAAQRRDRFLNHVASKAAFYNARHEHTVKHVRSSHILDARTTVVKLESKMAAAEYLRTLDLRLRQSKAALTNEKAANVVERQRLSHHVSPMIGAARIRQGLYRASQNRADVLTEVANKAHGFVRRAVLTCAAAEIRAKEHSEMLKANLDQRLAAAAERKGDLLALNVTALAGGGPSPDRATSARSPAGRHRSAAERACSAGALLAAAPRLLSVQSPAGGGTTPGGTVFRPPSPGSPYYYSAASQQPGSAGQPRRARSSRSSVKSRHSSMDWVDLGAGGDACFSLPSSPVGA